MTGETVRLLLRTAATICATLADELEKQERPTRAIRRKPLKVRSVRA